jgi:hypothetical protein
MMADSTAGLWETAGMASVLGWSTRQVGVPILAHNHNQCYRNGTTESGLVGYKVPRGFAPANACIDKYSVLVL